MSTAVPRGRAARPGDGTRSGCSPRKPPMSSPRWRTGRTARSSTTSASAAQWSGDDDAAHAVGTREHRSGEDAAYGAHGAVEAELSQDEEVGEGGFGDHGFGDEDREGDRQIEAAARLAEIGGREVDRHLLERQVVADGLERALDPRRAFFHRRCGEADDAVLQQAALDASKLCAGSAPVDPKSLEPRRYPTGRLRGPARRAPCGRCVPGRAR